MVPLTPYTGPAPWLTWGWGWRSDFDLVVSVTPCLGFPIRRTLTPFCRRGAGSLTSHSFFQPQDSIGLLLESSGQSFSVTGGFCRSVEPKENVYGCLGAQDHLWLSFWSHSALLGLFLWVFLSAKCLFIFLSLFTPLGVLSCFLSQLGSTYIKAGWPHSFWYPPLWPTSDQGELAGCQPAVC